MGYPSGPTPAESMKPDLRIRTVQGAAHNQNFYGALSGIKKKLHTAVSKLELGTEGDRKDIGLYPHFTTLRVHVMADRSLTSANEETEEEPKDSSVEKEALPVQKEQITEAMDSVDEAETPED